MVTEYRENAKFHRGGMDISSSFASDSPYTFNLFPPTFTTEAIKAPRASHRVSRTLYSAHRGVRNSLRCKLLSARVFLFPFPEIHPDRTLVIIRSAVLTQSTNRPE